MNTLWIALGAAAAVAGVMVALKYIGKPTGGASVDVGLGNVSDAWLSENRSRKDP